MAALAGFVPEIWSSKINLALQKSLVFASVCNRDYEGEVRGFGDVVKINAIGPIAVADYTPDSSTLTYSVLSDAQRELKIDQAKSISFKVDDVVKMAYHSSNVMMKTSQIRGNLNSKADGNPELSYAIAA